MISGESRTGPGKCSPCQSRPRDCLVLLSYRKTKLLPLCDVCKIYKPNLNYFKCKPCNSHEPFLSCAHTCVFCLNPFLPISGFSAPRHGIDSMVLCSQARVQLIYSIPSLIKGTLITCLYELSSSWAAHY